MHGWAIDSTFRQPRLRKRSREVRYYFIACARLIAYEHEDCSRFSTYPFFGCGVLSFTTISFVKTYAASLRIRRQYG